MSVLEIVLAVTVVWLAGALLVVLVHENYRADEHLALAFWFVLAPLGLTLRWYRRWAYTCPDCKGNYGDRKHYDLHMVKRTHCTVPPVEPASV